MSTTEQLSAAIRELHIMSIEGDHRVEPQIASAVAGLLTAAAEWAESLGYDQVQASGDTRAERMWLGVLAVASALLDEEPS